MKFIDDNEMIDESDSKDKILENDIIENNIEKINNESIYNSNIKDNLDKDDSISLKEYIEDNNICFDSTNDIIRLIDHMDLNNNNQRENNDNINNEGPNNNEKNKESYKPLMERLKTKSNDAQIPLIEKNDKNKIKTLIKENLIVYLQIKVKKQKIKLIILKMKKEKRDGNNYINEKYNFFISILNYIIFI